jgi:hypothetical protein
LLSTATVAVASLAAACSSSSGSPPSAPRAAVQAVSQTIAGKASSFNLTVNLSAPLQHLLGASQASLTGSGVVDYSTKRAMWSIAMPPAFGQPLRVVAVGDTTYLTVPGGNSADPQARWIAVSSVQGYSSLDQIPFVRDLVVLTNPLRGLALVDSVHQAATTTSLAPPNDPGATVKLMSYRNDSVPIASANCPDDPTAAQVDSGSVNGQIADTLSINQQATATTLKSWVTNEITAYQGREGLCSFSVSVNNADDGGFDVVYSLQEATPANITPPNLQYVFEMKDTLHIAPPPCLPGKWTASLPSDGSYPWLLTSTGDTTYSPWTGHGTVEIGISSDGEITYDATGTYNSTQTVPNYFADIYEGDPVLTEPVNESLSIKGPLYPVVNPAFGSLPSQNGPIDIIINGTAELTIAGGNYTGMDGSQTKPVLETITGSYTCSPDTGTGTITADVPNFGDLTFTKSNGEPPNITVNSDSSWRQIETSGSSSDGSGGSTSATSQSPPTTLPAVMSGRIGSTLRDAQGDTITVSGYGPATPLPNQYVPAGSTVMAIQVKACAAPGDAEPFFSTWADFSLTLTDGTSPPADLGLVSGWYDPPNGEIAAGQCVSGAVAYEVPSGAQGATVVGAGSLLSNQNFTWSLR